MASELIRFGLWRKSNLDKRPQVRNILVGDRNTMYFEAVASHRSRKKMVDALAGPNGLLEIRKV